MRVFVLTTDLVDLRDLRDEIRKLHLCDSARANTWLSGPRRPRAAARRGLVDDVTTSARRPS
jgi:hypothetical protein